MMRAQGALNAGARSQRIRMYSCNVQEIKRDQTGDLKIWLSIKCGVERLCPDKVEPEVHSLKPCSLPPSPNTFLAYRPVLISA